MMKTKKRFLLWLIIFIVMTTMFVLGGLFQQWRVVGSNCIKNEPTKSYEDAQKKMITLMEKYCESHDPYLRIEIMRGSGLYETVAGRIFNAFSIYCSNAGSFDREWGTHFAEDARRELYRNPQLTLAVLLPVLEEDAEPESDALKWHGPAKEDILLLVLDFALIEEDTFAASFLREWSRKTKDDDAYHYYLQHNLNVTSTRYKADKDRSSLWRLGDYALRSLPTGKCQRGWIEKYLGHPDSIDGDNYHYKCSDSNDVLTVLFGPDDVILKISGFNFNDNQNIGQDIKIGL